MQALIQGPPESSRGPVPGTMAIPDIPWRPRENITRAVTGTPARGHSDTRGERRFQRAAIQDDHLPLRYIYRDSRKWQLQGLDTLGQFAAEGIDDRLVADQSAPTARFRKFEAGTVGEYLHDAVGAVTTGNHRADGTQGQGDLHVFRFRGQGSRLD